MWQALVFSHGGTMLTADEKKVAFDGPAGQKAMHASPAGRPKPTCRIRAGAGAQDFVAGRLGIWAHSSSRIGGVIKQVGGVFTCGPRSSRWAPRRGRLPAGGNVAMMLAKDPAKQKAAWEYMKFATGPHGATIMVKSTGYVPANDLPAKDPEMLGDFYAQNPNHRVAIGQLRS